MRKNWWACDLSKPEGKLRKINKNKFYNFGKYRVFFDITTTRLSGVKSLIQSTEVMNITTVFVISVKQLGPLLGGYCNPTSFGRGY